LSQLLGNGEPSASDDIIEMYGLGPKVNIQDINTQ
jgi:hypothetical protein